MHEQQLFQFDKTLVRASFDRAAASYDAAAALQREAGKRMLERLDYVRITPRVVVDVGCGTGLTVFALMKRYRKAQVYGLDIAPAMLTIARRRTPWFRKLRCICGDAEALPLASSSCDLLFSNLALQWCNLDVAFREFQRVLKPGGLLMFTTLGPDTLTELRQSWQSVDSYNHVNTFIDMHDVGDALVRAAMADPVMDVERIAITYQDVVDLMRDLKNLGAHNISAGRAPNLTGKGRLQALREAYDKFRRSDGALPATYELIHGHAWAPTGPCGYRQEDGSTAFPLSGLRRQHRR